MRRLAPLLAAVSLVTLLPAGPAFAHRTSEPVTASETTALEDVSDNVTLVAHHYFPEGTDMQFQRREGAQMLDGEAITGTRDFAFVGADAKSGAEDGAMEIFDVTDPTDPVHLAEMRCQGYHAEVVVYENLMIQVIGTASGNRGCAEEQQAILDPNGIDRTGVTGLRIFDVTDPARPFITAFLGADEGITGGQHNATVVPWAGLLYLAQAGFTPDGDLNIIDLTDPSFPVTSILMQTISPGAGDLCHDIGLDPERELAFCPAITSTFIWDISDPMAPTTVAEIVNPKLTIHHGARLAPDGVTLVLNDEHAGALDEDVPIGNDTGVGTNGCIGDPTVGALWFYDTTVPEVPILQGSFAPTAVQPLASPCTSHFYNFIPDSAMAVVGWYEAGIIVVDFSNPMLPTQAAVFLPELGSFWTASYWHGYLYGSSRTIRAKGFGGGLWIAQMDGVGDLEPSPYDEGTSWMRWTSQLAAAPTPVEPAPTPEPTPPASPLPTTGGGLAFAGALGMLGLAGVRRRR